MILTEKINMLYSNEMLEIWLTQMNELMLIAQPISYRCQTDKSAIKINRGKERVWGWTRYLMCL